MMFDKNQINQLIESGKFTQSAAQSQCPQCNCLFHIDELSRSNASSLLNIARLTTFAFPYN